jgi:glycosyltransferase involved in cell wall biosynthesis
MNVLALASFPVEAAATRYRLSQFVAPLAERGITLTIRPFIDSTLFSRLYSKDAVLSNSFDLLNAALLRLKDVLSATRADVVIIQREAMMFGPPIIEWLITRIFRRPMVLDLDDATYVPYTSPTYGRVGKALKWFSKTDDLIRWSRIVICGNRTIGEYVSSKGATALVIPTVADTDIFRPALASGEKEKPVLGWIGTHSTYPYLESILSVLQRLASDHSFRLKIVGAGRKELIIPGIEVENLEWQLDREVEDFQSFDIGLYPIVPTLYAKEWATGKSGFKAIQYMAVGIPYVASPVGAVSEIGEVGKTHLCASTDEQWLKALRELIVNREKRERMGKAGRDEAIAHYGLAAQATKLATALREAAERS